MTLDHDKIALSFELIDFRSTVMKSFLIESINDVESNNENVQSIDENIQSIFENVQSSDHQNNLSAEFFEIINLLAIVKSVRVKRFSLRY
jgi:hypothetical protein